MRVTFRPIDHRDCNFLGLTQPGKKGMRGQVVTIDGKIALAFDATGEVIYQNNSGAVPDLVRASERVTSALSHL